MRKRNNTLWFELADEQRKRTDVICDKSLPTQPEMSLWLHSGGKVTDYLLLRREQNRVCHAGNRALPRL
jgi:hypothetical protein